MAPAKEARMACSAADEASFIKQQELLRDRCAKALADHLEANPDVVWTPEDGYGEPPKTEEEVARLKLVVDVEFDEETGQPIFPPGNNRLSDELVYLVTKFMNARDLARRYPYDFDKMGHINPQRVSSGPAPIIWAHGLPSFPVYKGYYILCGRDHAECIGWLLHERTKEIMHANPIWSIGAVIAPDSAVNLPHTITRQMTQHKPYGAEKDSRYKGKAWTRDIVAAEHHLCAVLPNLGTEEIEVCPMWRAWGYNARCGPMKRGAKPTTMPKEFFANHGIKDIDYDSLARPYGNHLMDEDEETDDETDPDGDIEVKDPVEKSGEISSSGNQPIMAQSASQMDLNMGIDSPMEGSKQVTEEVAEEAKEEVQKEAQKETQKETQEEAVEVAKEEVKKDVAEVVLEVSMKQVTEEIAKDPGIASSDLDEKQPVLSSSIVVTESLVAEQISTAGIPFGETTIQAAAIVQPTEVQLMTNQPETEQEVTVTSAEITLAIDPLKVKQIAPEQPSTEQLDHAAACGLFEKPKVANDPASQSVADDTDVVKS